MPLLIRSLVRRLVRLFIAIAALPLAGIAAGRIADRLERDAGPSTKSRLLRQAGDLASRRRR
jgi:hypothetical protein